MSAGAHELLGASARTWLSVMDDLGALNKGVGRLANMTTETVVVGVSLIAATPSPAITDQASELVSIGGQQLREIQKMQALVLNLVQLAGSMAERLNLELEAEATRRDGEPTHDA
jgi:hypothetical protein